MTNLIEIAQKHGNPHKVLLQLTMARSGIRTSKMIEVFSAICTACSLDTEVDEQCTPELLCDTLIETINPILQPLDLAVGVSTSHTVTDEKFFVLFSPSSSSALCSKMLVFSNNEQLIFQKWVKIMFVESAIKERGELDGTIALNACVEEGVRPLQAQEFLNKLTNDNILQRLNDIDSYVFTPRAIMELEARLRASAYDIPSCPVCSHLVIIRRFSQHCFICNTVIHSACLHKMITLSSAAVACPGLIDETIRCTNKFDNEALEAMQFDTPAPEIINRQVEIVGVRGGTQAPESDGEKAEDFEEHENGDGVAHLDELENETNNVDGERNDDQDVEMLENGFNEEYDAGDQVIFVNPDEELEPMGEDEEEEEAVEEDDENETENGETNNENEEEEEEEVWEEEEEAVEEAAEDGMEGEEADDEVEDEEEEEDETEEQRKNVTRAKPRIGDALDELLAEPFDED